MISQAGEDGSVSKRLRALREQHGYTQVSAAERFGIPVDTWRSWESGRRSPAPYVMRMLEMFLDRKGRFLSETERAELSAAVADRIACLKESGADAAAGSLAILERVSEWLNG